MPRVRWVCDRRACDCRIHFLRRCPSDLEPHAKRSKPRRARPFSVSAAVVRRFIQPTSTTNTPQCGLYAAKCPISGALEVRFFTWDVMEPKNPGKNRTRSASSPTWRMAVTAASFISVNWRCRIQDAKGADVRIMSRFSLKTPSCIENSGIV